MNCTQTAEDSLNAYELYLLEFDVSQKAQKLIEQMKQKLEDNNKLILEKLEHVDIMAQQYILQNNFKKQNNSTSDNKTSMFYKYIERLKKLSA